MVYNRFLLILCGVTVSLKMSDIAQNYIWENNYFLFAHSIPKLSDGALLYFFSFRPS